MCLCETHLEALLAAVLPVLLLLFSQHTHTLDGVVVVTVVAQKDGDGFQDGPSRIIFCLLFTSAL